MVVFYAVCTYLYTYEFIVYMHRYTYVGSCRISSLGWLPSPRKPGAAQRPRRIDGLFYDVGPGIQAYLEAHGTHHSPTTWLVTLLILGGTYTKRVRVTVTRAISLDVSNSYGPTNQAWISKGPKDHANVGGSKVLKPWLVGSLCFRGLLGP